MKKKKASVVGLCVYLSVASDATVLYFRVVGDLWRVS